MQRRRIVTLFIAIDPPREGTVAGD
jgi:hypothetical protein